MNKKTESKTIKTNRYDFILKLGEGGMGAVYKVVDRLTGLLVALKEIKVEQVRKKDDFETLTEEELALMNEFQILSSLRHPNIVSVLDYGLDEEMPYFTMELLAAPQSLTEYTKGKSRAIKIHMLVQLLQALAYLHHRNIIHRDLKPANILIDGNGVLKVLDFGIALAQDYLVPAQDSLSGTLAYLAPEVLQGTPVSFASDLYAFGVIAYEVLTEKYPYQYNHIGNLLEAIIHNRVDISLLDDDIAAVVGRLLEKDPEDRYQQIDKLIKDFVDASKYEMPVETLAIRESFLNAASFVGREEYFRQLKGLLAKAIEGQGQVCLVAGESGVGKSRLLSELRVLALVERVLVLRGQAVATAGSPYHLWRHIFRYLIIMSELSDTEGSIMGTIVSDIDMLLGREVDTAADLAPNAVRERFESTVLNIFRRQKLPILLILEDLHWADEESLSLAKRVSEIAGSLPIFILGSYRNDESPDLPKQFPQAQVITLERFDSEKMARLSSALLGKIGQEPKLVQFLYNETAGNVFFAIEVIRVLANQVGNLRDISQMALPSEITAGGVLAVLRQRLERIPAEHYPLVQYAALYGRELDLNLLRHLMPEHNHEQWFEVLSQLSIIEVEDNIWRFTHDKLREEVVRKLETDSAASQDHHHKLALGLEALYPNNNDYVSALAFHWAGAKVPDKAVSYSEKAAEIIYRYAPNRAIKHIETVISFDKGGGSVSKERLVMRHAILGSCHYIMGNYEDALDSLETMVGHLGASPMPGNPVLGGFALLSQVVVHTAHRLLPGQFLAKHESDWLPQNIVTNLYDMPMIYMAQGKMPQALYSIVMNANYVETLKPGSKSNPALSYAWLHFVLGLIPLRGLSNYYRNKVTEILSDKQQAETIPSLIKGGIQATLMVSDFYNARWESMLSNIGAILDIASSTGEPRSFELGLYYLGMAYHLLGRFNNAKEEFQRAYLQNITRNDIEMRFSLFSHLTGLLLRTGQLADAEFSDLWNILEKDEGGKIFKTVFETNRHNEALYLTLKSGLYLSQARTQDASKALLAATEIIKSQSFEPNPTYFFLYEMILMDVYSLLSDGTFKQRLNITEQGNLFNAAKGVLKLIKQAGRVMDFAEPLYHLGQAWITTLEGKNEPARGMAQKSIDRADELTLPYYKALAQLTLAELTSPVDTKLRQEALDALEQMGLRILQPS